MKKYLYLLSSLTILAASTVAPNAMAVDIEHGGQVFSANCSACHAGGKNVIMAEKTLEKEALEKFEMNSIASITSQVTNGKGAMPAFGGRLLEVDIEDVANYVISQSENGW